MDAREYHESTKHSPQKLREQSVSLDPRTRPRPTKRYLSLPSIDLERIRPPHLPALSAIAQSRASPSEGAAPRSIDQETLATLCYEAAGITERARLDDGRLVHFRAASCTGKLYHVDCYPVVGDVDGIEPGVYHFDPESFALDILREGDYRGVLADAAGESDASSTGVQQAPVTIVCTSTWWRNAWKYRERTYRHAFWDSGTILANLLAGAHATGHRAAAVAGFADGDIVDLLGLEPAWEAPIALAPIGAGDPAPEPRDVTPIDPETEPVSPDWTDYPAIVEAWRASTLPDGDAASDWRTSAVQARGTGATTGEGADSIQLEPVSPETQTRRPLSATIRRRRSCRAYERAGPSHKQVATILDRATRGVPGDWNEGAADGLEYNDCYLLATGVEGLPDGSYYYDERTDTLERLGEATNDQQRHLALNQGWAGQAHVNVYLLADVDAITDELGNRGYRLAQLEAGIVLGRLYLATYAHRDLGGTGLTFFDDAVTEHFAPRAAEQTPMTLFAFGTAGD